MFIGNISTGEGNNSSGHHFGRFVANSEGGIFSGKGLLNSALALFLVQATIIIGLSRLIHRGAIYYFGQPRVIAEIIGGICLGPSLLGRIPNFTDTIFPQHSLPTLALIANFGLVLYMFLMGLEVDISHLLRDTKRFLVISLAGIILPGALGAAISYGLYANLLEEEKRVEIPFFSFLLFTFVALAITAFPVLARILMEKKLLTTTVGMMAISAAAIDDICAWILLALSVSIINADNSLVAIYVLAAISFYAALLLLPGRILLRKGFEKWLKIRTKNGDNKKVLTQILLALVFMMLFLSAWTTEWIGVHAIFGAFLAGIIIPRNGKLTTELANLIEDTVTIVFLPLYFASSGLKTKFGLLNDWTAGVFCVAVIMVACIGKIVGCMAAAKLTGSGWREAFSIGILMNTKGLVDLIVLNIGLDAGVINDRIFAVMVVMALVTTVFIQFILQNNSTIQLMTSPIISIVYPPKYHQQQHAKEENENVAAGQMATLNCRNGE